MKKNKLKPRSKIKVKHVSVLSLVLILVITLIQLVFRDEQPQTQLPAQENTEIQAEINLETQQSSQDIADKETNSNNNTAPQAKNPNWHPTISPYYAEGNNNTNSSKCTGQKSCTTTVTDIVDGDTIVISSGEKVRYVGVNTPETKHPTKGVECFGKEASGKNRELVLNKEVRLEKDISDKDRYGRLLRFVYIGDLFINDYLTRQGYAHAATFPPDVKLSKQFIAAEKEARENGRGLWAPGVCP